MQAHNRSTTIYVGNLSFKIWEEKIWEFFSKIGEIKRIITGINRIDLSPCGFCFVEFYHSKFGIFCILNLNGLKLNSRVLKVDIDEGFKEGRQYGRGKEGGQLKEDLKIPQKLSRFLKKRK
jgi:nuclear cap-binding protein subunit 2